MMRHATFRTLRIAALVLLLMGAEAAQAADLAGSVVGVGGQVVLARAGQRFSLRLSDPVYVDDVLEVAADGRLKLRMSDGSVLSLAPQTVMRIDAYSVDANGRRRAAGLSVGTGLLRSVTVPGAGPARFEVDTAVGATAVRSTDWFVDAMPGAEQVAVLSGSVLLTSRSTGRGVDIPAGFGTRLEAGGDPAPPRPLNPAEFGQLIARSEGAAPPPPPPGPAPYPPGPGYAPPRGILLPIPGGDGNRPRPGRGQEGSGDRGGSPSPGKAGPKSR